LAGISVDGLCKHWGEMRAVDGIAFAAHPQEFIALLGPSGCGKSTTLRLIAGLETATAGRIIIDGRDVTHLPPAKRQLSMVFQSYALFPHLNVRDNILFGLSVRRVAKAEQQDRLDRVAELLGLTALLKRRPSQLSGGQQQRVALGRALIAETRVCLLDEPLSNLDARLRGEMRSEIRALQRRLGITMLFVTHDQTEAMSMADRIILMRDGRIEQNGTPVELYGQPASVFAATFIGTPPMNILDARDAGFAGLDGTLVGVRPEDVRLAPAGLPAEVETSEYFGADSIIACRLAGSRILVRVPGMRLLAGGNAVHLSLPSAALHFFDARTGLRQPAPRDLPASPNLASSTEGGRP
jgi:sn-glycerol 3-phosphate transport system ATP-binding protein